MKKWFHSLTRQGKMMLLLIVLLLIGIILRWDNIRQKAGIWFRYDDIMEQRADSLRQATGPAPDSLPAADSLPVPARR